MVLSGLATSAAAPQLVLFLVQDLHLSLAVAGLYYLTNLTAPIAGYLVGRRSDRTGRRLGLFRVCVVAGALGFAVIAVAPEPWIPFVVSAVVLGFGGAAAGQLFAAVHDHLVADPDPAGDQIVNVVRMALTAGWIVGPALGSWLGSQFGLRWMLFVVAVLTAAQLLPTARLRTEGTATTGPSSVRPNDLRVFPGFRTLLPLLTFTGLYVLVYAGEPIKYGFLPVYMTDTLHLGAGLRGVVIGLQPLVEFVVMPVSIRLARRTGGIALMAGGAALAVTANLCFATTGSAAGMIAGQVLMGGVWGVFASLGILAAQRLLPTAIATASSIFITAPAFSSALGGALGSIGVATLGLPHVFFIPASLAAGAVLGLAAMARYERRPSLALRPADGDLAGP